uniref:G-protein coupled receptors family 2 profile 2 domain-containing protein n=1 Tax=Sinocyclocheilus anshuiensis TaxID=1608454 RepID=A0A671RDL5_9TELE
RQVEGVWSGRGCEGAWSNSTHTVCYWSHFSSFAVLMALYPVQLVLITRVGLALSLVCLFLCILTFRFCRSIKGTRTSIHLHLSICLFIADLVFLCGISSTHNPVGCAIVAGLLHFFFLFAFCWMLLEGVQLYQMVVLVFHTILKHLYMYLVGYGVPLVIVTVSAIAFPTGYGTDRHCWLSRDRYFILSFFAPVCIIVILNGFVFIITVWKLARKFSSLNPDLSNLNQISFTMTAVAQLCILGGTWIFGFFLFQEKGTEVMLYLFIILNSLQGALIFIMHCLLSKPVSPKIKK